MIAQLTCAFISSEVGAVALASSGFETTAASLAALLPGAPLGPFAIDGTLEIVARLGLQAFPDAGFATIGNLRTRAGLRLFAFKGTYRRRTFETGNMSFDVFYCQEFRIHID